MRIVLILICGLLLQNCSGNNKKVIKSPDDLQSFVNVFCAKNTSTAKVIRVCASEYSKNLTIAENKTRMNLKLQIADIIAGSVVSQEIITHKEGKSIVKTYDLNATSNLDDVSIAGYKIVHRKILKESGGWRVLILAEYKLT
jgi:hypothetical protein